MSDRSFGEIDDRGAVILQAVSREICATEAVFVGGNIRSVNIFHGVVNAEVGKVIGVHAELLLRLCAVVEHGLDKSRKVFVALCAGAFVIVFKIS